VTTNVTTPTTGADRRLLADVHRWARTNGWTPADWRGRQNAPTEDQATIAVRTNEAGFQVWRKTTDAPHFTGQPTDYPADSVRQAVDLLAALNILPAQFSSAYQAGWHDGYFADVEDETRAEIRAAWSTR
jgi:hypothetical protein